VEEMSAAHQINHAAYAKLLVKALPQPIRDDREHARLTQMLLRLDESDGLKPEEEALAEVLTLLIEDYAENRHLFFSRESAWPRGPQSYESARSLGL
jgi:hypothetical protein